MTKTHQLTPAEVQTFAARAGQVIEDVAPSVIAAHVCLSLTSGEDVSAAPEALTVYTSPEGLPLFVEVQGEDGPQVFALPPTFARVFAWGLLDRDRAAVASALTGAHFHLADLLEDPAGADGAKRAALALHFLEDAARDWPEEDGEEEDGRSGAVCFACGVDFSRSVDFGYCNSGPGCMRGTGELED